MLPVYLIAEEKILFLKPEQEKDKTYFTDKEVRKHFIKKSFRCSQMAELSFCMRDFYAYKFALCERVTLSLCMY